ncbi:MAG TPA: hypothetical protein VH502_13755, partial [Actinoplanes sp.]
PPPNDGSVPPGHAVPPNKPADRGPPADPEEQAPPPLRPPFCHERGKCGIRESRHYRPDWSRHRQCEDAAHRAHWSHHREGRSRGIAVPIAPTGRHGVHATIRERPARPHRFSAIVHDGSTQDRSPDRSEHTRRSTVTERPSNVRPQRWGDRTHNSLRHRSESHWDDGHALAGPYRGSHRADDRSSRAGRHHARTDRW